MPDKDAVPGWQRRIASLSAEQRQLLERLQCAGARAANATSAHQGPAVEPGATQRAALSGHHQRLREFYDEVSATLDGGPLGPHALFLNYGYTAEEDERTARPVATRSLNEHHIRLVLEVIGDVDLNGCDVLDVGCGRGGTIDVISRRARIRRLVGIDLSTNAIRFCRAFRRTNVSVLEAEAERLPFRDQSFDAVVNIESSHCYTDLASFYGEVRRVLRPHGRFLYADLLPPAQMHEWLTRLCANGFVREQVRDITAPVLRACRERAAQHARAFAEGPPSRKLEEFVGLPGSNVYAEMETGVTTYQIWQLRRTGSV